MNVLQLFRSFVYFCFNIYTFFNKHNIQINNNHNNQAITKTNKQSFNYIITISNPPLQTYGNCTGIQTSASTSTNRQSSNYVTMPYIVSSPFPFLSPSPSPSLSISSLLTTPTKLATPETIKTYAYKTITNTIKPDINQDENNLATKTKKQKSIDEIIKEKMEKFGKVYRKRLKRVCGEYEPDNVRYVDSWVFTSSKDSDLIHKIYRQICRKHGLIYFKKYEGNEKEAVPDPNEKEKINRFKLRKLNQARKQMQTTHKPSKPTQQQQQPKRKKVFVKSKRRFYEPCTLHYVCKTHTKWRNEMKKEQKRLTRQMNGYDIQQIVYPPQRLRNVFLNNCYQPQSNTNPFQNYYYFNLMHMNLNSKPINQSNINVQHNNDVTMKNVQQQSSSLKRKLPPSIIIKPPQIRNKNKKTQQQILGQGDVFVTHSIGANNVVVPIYTYSDKSKNISHHQAQKKQEQKVIKKPKRVVYHAKRRILRN